MPFFDKVMKGVIEQILKAQEEMMKNRPPSALFYNRPSPWDVELPVKHGPGIYAFNWAWEDKQYGYCWFEIDSNGTGKCHILFSNGKKWDGDTFNAAFSLLDEKQQPLHTFEWRAGMNSAGSSGGAKERRTAFDISKPTEWWDRVKYVKVIYQMIDTVSDQKVWDAIIEVIKTIAEGDESETQTQNNP